MAIPLFGVWAVGSTPKASFHQNSLCGYVAAADF
jgi:hypothetical protein